MRGLCGRYIVLGVINIPLLHWSSELAGNWKIEDVEVVFVSSEEDKPDCCLCWLQAREKGRDKN